MVNLEKEVKVDIVGAFRKNLALLVIATLVGGALAFGISQLMPNRYTATCTFYVLTNDPNATAYGMITGLDAGQLLTADVMTLMDSVHVKEAVSKQLDIEDIDQYSFSVENTTDTRIVTLRVTGEDPELAADIADATVTTLAGLASNVMPIRSIQIIEPVAVPTIVSSPNRRVLTIAGALFTFFILFFIILLRDLMDLRVRDDDQALDLVGAPIIAHFSAHARRKATDKERRNDQNSAKTLLANIRFMAVDEPLKTFLVTSSIPNEGKTTTSILLAKAMATSNKRTLLVECDMRRRSVAAALRVHASYGIHAVLTGEILLEDATVKTLTPNLWFLDAEPHIPNPSDLLSSKRFKSLLETLRNEYDYVIFDTPPVGTFVDAAVLGPNVDAALLVVRKYCTKRDELLPAVQQLRSANVPLAGTILTFCEKQNSEYYYEYYEKDGERQKRRKERA